MPVSAQLHDAALRFFLCSQFFITFKAQPSLNGNTPVGKRSLRLEAWYFDCLACICPQIAPERIQNISAVHVQQRSQHDLQPLMAAGKYTIFAHVIDGMDVLEKMERTPTGTYSELTSCFHKKHLRNAMLSRTPDSLNIHLCRWWRQTLQRNQAQEHHHSCQPFGMIVNAYHLFVSVFSSVPCAIITAQARVDSSNRNNSYAITCRPWWWPSEHSWLPSLPWAWSGQPLP